MKDVKIWAVTGERTLSDGSTTSILSTSFGSTEERAREWFARIQQRSGFCKDWRPEQLKFTEEVAR